MLDAYIIDRIRREREQSERTRQVPLHIEPPLEPLPRPEDNAHDRDDRGSERGSVVIDYQL